MLPHFEACHQIVSVAAISNYALQGSKQSWCLSGYAKLHNEPYMLLPKLIETCRQKHKVSFTLSVTYKGPFAIRCDIAAAKL